MSFLLDTNVVSEWVKLRPDTGVISWLAEMDEDRVFLSVVTLAELRYGIERMGTRSWRNRLEFVALDEELPIRFEGRVLAVDAPVAESWGRVVALRQAMGRTMSIMDGFLTATAEVHGLTMVTRSVADFAALGQAVFNPWSA